MGLFILKRVPRRNGSERLARAHGGGDRFVFILVARLALSRWPAIIDSSECASLVLGLVKSVSLMFVSLKSGSFNDTELNLSLRCNVTSLLCFELSQLAL